MWVPFVPYPRDLVRGNVRNFTALVVGRLKPGVSIAQGRADLERITATIRQAYPTWLQDRSVAVVPLRDSIVGPAKPWMLMLLGSVTFVLLIACVNVANLLLARATARSRDVAVRAALGASRWTIVRGLLIESLILSATGAALGVCLAVWGVHVLRASLPPSLPRLDEVAVNYRVLIAAACAALAVAVGVTPVWQSPASALSRSLNEPAVGMAAWRASRCGRRSSSPGSFAVVCRRRGPTHLDFVRPRVDLLSSRTFSGHAVDTRGCQKDRAGRNHASAQDPPRSSRSRASEGSSGWRSYRHQPLLLSDHHDYVGGHPSPNPATSPTTSLAPAS